jgi:hypothetical protein
MRLSFDLAPFIAAMHQLRAAARHRGGRSGAAKGHLRRVVYVFP